MRNVGLVCKTKSKLKATNNSEHNLPVADKLLDWQFTVQQPNQAYDGNITYIHTQVVWLYLAIVIDIYSMHLMCWPIAEFIRTLLVNDALLMSIWKRKPVKGLLRNSDHAVNMQLRVIESF